MLFRLSIYLFIVLLFGNGWSSVEAAAEWKNKYKVGDRVVSIQSVTVTNNGRLVTHLGPGALLHIEQINGNQLWISYGKAGWINASSVLPLNEKVLDYFTKKMKAEPKNEEWHYARAMVYAYGSFHKEAIADFTQLIKANPKGSMAAAYYNARGAAWKDQKKYDLAVKDLSKSITLSPNRPEYYNARGMTLRYMKKYDLAIADFNKAIQLDPKSPMLYNNRGNVWREKREYRKAIADYDESLRLNPNDRFSHANKARILAAAPDFRIRNGTKAIELAKIACGLSGWKAFYFIDTLAAAYAETDNFERAIHWQKKAISLAPLLKGKKGCQQRLKLYEAKKSYRLPAKKTPSKTSPKNSVK